MSDPLHPTSDEWVMFDPDIDPPPTGVHLLLLTPGGVLVTGFWNDCFLAWAYKPKVPASVKNKSKI